MQNKVAKLPFPCVTTALVEVPGNGILSPRFGCQILQLGFVKSDSFLHVCKRLLQNNKIDRLTETWLFNGEIEIVRFLKKP